MKSVNVKDFNTNIFQLLDDQWGVLTVGSPDNFNALTISWGMLGTLWGGVKKGRNIFTVFVKPDRYSHKFIEENDYYTVSFFSKEHIKALGLLGSKSGRDMDKIAASGLHPILLDKGITYEEAERTFIIHKLYRHQPDKSLIPHEIVEEFYSTNDGNDLPHTMYIGEVVELLEK